MKKRLKTILVAVMAAVFVYVLDIFVGNPISWGIVKLHSRQYLNKTYPGQEIQVVDIYQDWYNGGGYRVTAASEVSRDTRFHLHYNRLGMLEWDGYAFAVESGRSTLSRLYEEYEKTVHKALEDWETDYACLPGLSVIDEHTGQGSVLPAGIDMSRLELDGEYDVLAMGAEYGYLSLSLYVQPEELTADHAAALLLGMKKRLDDANVGFVAVDLFMTVSESKDPYQSLGINGITRADLEAEDPAARLDQMRLEQLDYWHGTKDA